MVEAASSWNKPYIDRSAKKLGKRLLLSL